MKQIIITDTNLSDLTNQAKFSDHIFTIVGSCINNNDVEYVNCKFVIQKAGSLNFSKGTFSDCEFKCEDEYLPKSRAILLSHCVLKNCSIKGHESDTEFVLNGARIDIRECKDINTLKTNGSFYSLSFYKANIIKFTDKSCCEIFSLNDTVIRGFSIGGKANSLFITLSKFSSYDEKNVLKPKWCTLFMDEISIWNKEVILKAECTQSTFHKVKINPYYFATKCIAKSSFDLSGATIVDNWCYLRKEYSGINLIIIFIFTFLFFLPIIIKSLFLLLASKISTDIGYLENFENTPLWKVIFFGSKDSWLPSSIHCLLTSILLAYNIGRYWLTISIAKLRQEESFLQDSGFPVTSLHPEKYALELKVHKYLNVAYWVSIVYSIIKLVEALFIDVPFF